jgi:hypothetical protein
MFSDAGTSVAVELQRLLTYLRINEWLQEDLFHFRWFFLIGVFVFSAFLWWKLVDKSRLPEITLHAGLTAIITLILDEIGEELTLWEYPSDILAIFPPLSAVDLASLPMIYSLIYQYFTTWKSFFRATLIMATIFCFILEPLLVWTDFYQVLKWKYYYGFPIYILMAIFIRWLVIKIYALAEQAKASPDFKEKK